MVPEIFSFSDTVLHVIQLLMTVSFRGKKKLWNHDTNDQWIMFAILSVHSGKLADNYGMCIHKQQLGFQSANLLKQEKLVQPCSLTTLKFSVCYYNHMLKWMHFLVAEGMSGAWSTLMQSSWKYTRTAAWYHPTNLRFVYMYYVLICSDIRGKGNTRKTNEQKINNMQVCLVHGGRCQKRGVEKEFAFIVWA